MSKIVRSSSLLRSHFLWKLYAGYSILIVVCSLVMGSLIAQKIEQNTLEDINSSLLANANLLGELAATVLSKGEEGEKQLQKKVQESGREIGIRLTVIRDDGLVLADSDEEPTTMDNHTNRPEVLSAKLNGLGKSNRFSQTTNRNRMYLAIRINKENRVIGFARTSLPLSVVDQRLGELRWVIVMGTGLTTLVALFFGFLLARHTVKPLIRMTANAEEMASGKYGKKMPTTRKDEIGQLAEAFNLMAEKSQTRMEMLTTDRNKLSAILSGMVEGVIAVDPNGCTLHLNATAGNLLQVPPDESLGKPIREVTHIEEVCDILSEAVTKNTEVQRRLEITRTQDDQIIEMHASPIHDGRENQAGAVVVLHDVTKLYQLENIRRDFIANASHELKTPITAIRMLIETLIDDEELPAEKRMNFFKRIQNQSLRLTAIVTDLLRLSRLESKSEEQEMTSVDLCDLVLSSVNSFYVQSERSNVSISCDVPPHAVEIKGNDEGLSQLVNNLIDNALRYTTGEGTVQVTLEATEKLAVIQVRDNGIGIDVHDQKRIFERFYCVDKVRSRETGGTGLGLSIVKHVTLAHNGTVELESALGEGSTFRVKLPLIPESVSSQ